MAIPDCKPFSKSRVTVVGGEMVVLGGGLKHFVTSREVQDFLSNRGLATAAGPTVAVVTGLTKHGLH